MKPNVQLMGRSNMPRHSVRIPTLLLVLIIFLTAVLAIVLIVGDEHKTLATITEPLQRVSPSSSSYPDSKLLVAWEKQASERSKVFAKAGGISSSAFFNAMAPEVYCPSEFRVGGILDGGKWVCSAATIFPQNCTVLSLGIHDEWTFELDLQNLKQNTCSIVAVDMIQQQQATIDGFHKMGARVVKAAVRDQTNSAKEEISIADLVKNAGWIQNVSPGSNFENRVEILKIDIEGSEYSALPPALRAVTFCQIFIELHNALSSQRDMLKTLSAAGYRLFHYEINPGGGSQFAANEFSLLHDSCLDKYGAQRLGVFLARPSGT